MAKLERETAPSPTNGTGKDRTATMQAKATEMKSAAAGWTWRDGTAAFATAADMCGVDTSDADALKALRGRLIPALAEVKWSEITEQQYGQLVERAVMKAGETKKSAAAVDAVDELDPVDASPQSGADGAAPSIPAMRVTKVAAHVMVKRTANYNSNDFLAAMEVAVDGELTPAETGAVYDAIYDQLTAIIERQHAAHAVSLDK